MAEKIDIKTLPKYVKTIISVLPAVIIIIVVTFVILLPKNKEIKALENKILLQENEIAKSRAKAEKLPQLIAENQRLMRRLDELKLQLPEEKEVSSLLKQVSDLGIRSGLHIMLWKPEQKKTHPSGIVYVIPVRVDLTGNYHSLGYVDSRLTNLDRLMRSRETAQSDPRPLKDIASLKV